MQSPIPIRPLLLLALAIGAPAALTACSSSSGTTTTTAASGGSTATTTTGATTKAFTCAGAPVTEVNAALGTAVLAPATQTNGSVTVCTYTSTNPIQSVIIRVDTASGAATFAAEKAQFAAHSQTVASVTGVGDDAYSSTLSGGGFTTNTFAVRKGTAEVQVNGPGTPTQVQALAVTLVGTV